MAAIGAPGAAVTVIHHGEVIFDRGFGFKREGEPELVDTGTRFRIGPAVRLPRQFSVYAPSPEDEEP